MPSPDPGVESGSRSLPARLARTAGIYLENIRDDGGWGLSSGQVSSLVNTAEVLAILESGGIAYEHECVQRALTYLASNFPTHLSDPDRGPRTRYAIFTLLGLTEYRQASTRVDVHACLEFAVRWLKTSNRVAGGWTVDAESRELSIFATTAAMSALARAAPGDPAIEEGADSLLANSLGAATWPAEAGADHHGQPSHALTGLAALALFDAGRARPARAASRWLHDRPVWWSTRTEAAREEVGTPWRHMSFSICARAVLRAGAPVYDVRLRPSLQYLDSLWSQREGLWSDGTPRDHLTVRGAYAAALLYQELRCSILRMDPLSLANTLQPVPNPVRANARFLGMDLNAEEGEIIIESPQGTLYAITLDHDSHRLVKALATSAGRPLSARQLGDLLEVNAHDIQSKVNEINVAVWEQTDNQVQRLVEPSPKGFFIEIKSD